MKLSKKEVRKLALAKRAQLTEQEREAKSKIITELVLSLEAFQNAKTVMSFLNFRDEVETTTLAQVTLNLGKRLVLPLTAPQGRLIPAIISDLDKDIAPGTWGIREPKKDNLREADPAEIDLIIVPGAAFDRQGNRLGYGGGFYDRFFERVKPTTPRVALAFQCQVLEEIPVEPFDKKIPTLITEEGVFIL